MSKVNIPAMKTWVDGETIHASEYNAERNLIASALNDTQDQVSTLTGLGGITTEKLANGSVTASKLADNSVTASKILKEAVTQFTYDKAAIDTLIADALTAGVPQDVIDAIVAGATTAIEADKADYVRKPGVITLTGGTNIAYTGTLNPQPTSIDEGFGVTVVFHTACGVDPTLKINDYNPIPLKLSKGAPSAVAAAEFRPGIPYSFRKIGSSLVAETGDISLLDFALKAPLLNPVFGGTLKVGVATVVTSANISVYAPPVDTGDQPNILIHVDINTGIDAVDRGALGVPFKTITYALSTLKKHLTGNVNIRIKAGTYPEDIYIRNFDGPYSLAFVTTSGDAAFSVNLTGYVTVVDVTVLNVVFTGMKFANVLDARRFVPYLEVASCQFYTTSLYGILFGRGNLEVKFTNFLSKPTCISISSGHLTLPTNNTGTGNTVGVDADNGATVSVGGTINLGATTTFKVAAGANIFNTPSGVIRTT